MTPWNLNRADGEFSKFIRRRDGKCMNPKCICGLNYEGAPIAELDCSHYYGRGIWITRFDPDNCIALGRKCHQLWEDDKQGRYREFMIRRLGVKKFRDLQKKVDDYKYKSTPHLSLNEAIKLCREFLTHEKRKTKSTIFEARDQTDPAEIRYEHVDS